MFSNSCRYGLRAVVYLASKPRGVEKTGIKKISEDLGLPTPYLAKILQQLSKKKILKSAKGPHGGFCLSKDPGKIKLLDIVKSIDGEEFFSGCIIHNETCKCLDKKGNSCTLHDDFEKLRSDIINLFTLKSVADMVKKASDTDRVVM
jgi:Rrf2 family protein